MFLFVGITLFLILLFAIFYIGYSYYGVYYTAYYFIYYPVYNGDRPKRKN